LNETRFFYQNRRWSQSGFFLDQLPPRAAEQLLDEAGGINAAPEIGILHDGLLE
jgi:hypothetical protein